MQKTSTRQGILALSPIIVLLTIYLAGSIVAGDFYKIPIAAAFMAASVYAIAISRGESLNSRIENFSQGAANPRIMYMIWIFILAGAFAALAKAMGAVDATVNLTLNLIPGNYLPAGIFIAACFISMSIGTSVGTIVALTPVVTALAAQIGCDTAWLVAIVVGGAFFGDNLSFISDTTIAATQTQGCSMRSKFRTNIKLVTPAAIAALLLYAFSGNNIEDITAPAVTFTEGFKCLPYIIVIATALCGMNVLAVLLLGIAAAGCMGLVYGTLDSISIFTEMGSGIMGMCELIIVTMLAGGLLEIVRINGGLDYMIRIITLRVRSRRAAELAITALTALANLCTANNTIAILTVGDISRDISKKYSISPRRAASLLDTTSCVVQGIIPYGAQLLMAAGLAQVSPLEIIPNLYYPMCVAAAIAVSIIIKGKQGSTVKID
ncbi:MAG: Na+/H+ antiporter NhaC family protein [Bacteroidaceae bacterium]|nr:Na+/H+ antiporter NhaC family protein [Bacteroidaceae bacterium]